MQSFAKDRQYVTKHIANVFKEYKLEEKSNVQILHITVVKSIKL